MELTVKQQTDFEFTLYIKAISSGRPVITKNGGVFDRKAYRDFKQQIEDVIERDLGSTLLADYQQKVAQANGFNVEIISGYKTKNHDYWGLPKVTRPDADNIIKPIFDQILGRLGLEDSQIFNVCFKKYYASDDYITIKVTTYNVPTYRSKSLVDKAEKQRRKDEEIETKLNKFRKERGFI